MLSIFINILLLSSAWASCPDLNGKFACSYGPVIFPVEIVAKPLGNDSFSYLANGKSILINSQEQVMADLSHNKGINFKNIIYTGACANGVMNLSVKGSDATGEISGSANVSLKFSNRGQLSVQVAAVWEKRSRRFSLLCTPTR